MFIYIFVFEGWVVFFEWGDGFFRFFLGLCVVVLWMVIRFRVVGWL